MATHSCLQATLDGAVLLSVEVQPGAQNERLLEVNPWRSRLGIAVVEPAQKSQANQAVLGFLSRILEVPKASLSITNGLTSRKKTVRIEACECAAILTALEQAMEDR